MKHWASSTYAVHLLTAAETAAPIYRWAQWQHICTALNPVFALTSDTPVIRSCQISGQTSKQLPFGRMVWSTKNNEKWTEKYLSQDPDTQFIGTEIWAPDWNTMSREQRAPGVFVHVESHPRLGLAHSLTIAVVEPLYTNNLALIRASVERAQAIMPNSKHYFGRTPWAESVFDNGYSNGLSDRTAFKLARQLVAVAA